MKTAKHGFSMLETLSALVVAGLILTALFMVYDHARRISVSVLQKLDASTLPSEILQRISEDLDRLAGPGSNATVEIKNNFASGLAGAQIIITSRIADKDNKPQVLEEVIWQTSFDLATKRLILWRSHSGFAWEDKLLDKEERRDWTANRHVFVPLCTGLSVFKIQVPQFEQEDPNKQQRPSNFIQSRNFRRQDLQQRQRLQQNQMPDQMQDQETKRKFLDTWAQGIPPAVTITLSFDAPVDNGTGSMDVLENQKIIRTIILNRSKKVAFTYTPLFTDANNPDANNADKNNKKDDTNSSDKNKDSRASDSSSNLSNASGQPTDSGSDSSSRNFRRRSSRSR